MALGVAKGFGTLVAGFYGTYYYFNQVVENSQSGLVTEKTGAVSQRVLQSPTFPINDNTAAYKLMFDEEGKAKFGPVQATSEETKKYVDEGEVRFCSKLRYAHCGLGLRSIKAIVVGDKVPENACKQLQDFYNSFRKEVSSIRD